MHTYMRTEMHKAQDITKEMREVLKYVTLGIEISNFKIFKILTCDSGCISNTVKAELLWESPVSTREIERANRKREDRHTPFFKLRVVAMSWMAWDLPAGLVQVELVVHSESGARERARARARARASA
jgi:hypothetical protein